VDAVHDRDICEDEMVVAVRLVGVDGGVVSVDGEAMEKEIV
jgi:hypothetical protein